MSANLKKARGRSSLTDLLCLNETWKHETGMRWHRSLSKIIFGCRDDGDENDFAGLVVTLERSVIEADLSSKELGASGAIIVGAFLPRW